MCSGMVEVWKRKGFNKSIVGHNKSNMMIKFLCRDTLHVRSVWANLAKVLAYTLTFLDRSHACMVTITAILKKVALQDHKGLSCKRERNDW